MDPTKQSENLHTIFVGKLPYATDDNSLKEFFSSFGTVSKAWVVTREDGSSTGFGFVEFLNEDSLKAALEPKHHSLNGKTVDVKRAEPKGYNTEQAKHEENDAYLKQIFVGGISDNTNEQDLKEYFNKYGNVEEVDIKVDRLTGRKRGFAFVTFESADSVEVVAKAQYHTICTKQVEVKKAVASTRNMEHQPDGGFANNPDVKGYYGSGGYGSPNEYNPMGNMEHPPYIPDNPGSINIANYGSEGYGNYGRGRGTGGHYGGPASGN